MVERMTSVEIEDVLSSIRRLVAEDLRPKPVAVPMTSSDKLILTPALRVVPEDVSDVVQMPVLDVDLDSDFAAALTDQTTGTDTEAGDQPAADDGAAYPMFLHHANRVDVHTERTASDLADTVTTIAAGLPTEGYEAELGDVMAVPDWPESSWVAPEVIEVVEEAELIAVPESDLGSSVHDDWAPEVVVPTAAPDPLPTASAEDDAAEAAVLAALSDEDVGLQGPAALTELDEDMLREIVREIIREELQGGLGERITRNVRKLVRAEINRALMTQDLD